MDVGQKISGISYYDAFPSLEVSVGDIWQDLPAFGHLRKTAIKGVVITPACDLSNRKVETVTYLPIITVEDYLLGRGFAVELCRTIKSQGPIAKVDVSEMEALRGIQLPSCAALDAIATSAAKAVSKKGNGQKEVAAAERVIAAITILRGVRATGNGASVSEVATAIGKREFNRIVQDIVRNNYSADIHFLPGDGRVADLSVMSSHSLALFRYPICVPVEILDAANDSRVHDWPAAIRQLSIEFPASTSAKSRPMKIGTLRERFLPDLIARFTTLHVRMGSPDFSRETVEEFAAQLGASK